MPPAIHPRTKEAEAVRDAYAMSIEAYEHLVERLTARGLSRKAAREAARSVLPNAAPVDMVVTGNLRAWRDVLSKRHSRHADAEIQGFAVAVLRLLRELAPNSVQDLFDEPGE